MSQPPGEVAGKVAAAFSKYPKRSYPKGQIIVFAHESPEYIYYLVKGQVRSYDISYRGDEVVVNVFKPGAFFPMSWAINQTPNVYFFKTETAVELHVVQPQAAVEFVKSNPDVLYDLVSRVYRGLDGVLGRMVHLMAGTAKSRLLYELIIESRRFGKATPKGLRLPASEVDLAGRAGLSRETVSREMNKLKRSGLVTVDAHGICITDLAELERQLGSDI